MSAPTVKLNSGHEMPVLGLGTWKAADKDQLAGAVKHAIKSGYRHIDCAYAYSNEAAVGEGIRQAVQEGLVKREDLFVTSKLSNNYHHPEDVKPALKKSLADLGLEYLDLYLMHWPMAFGRGDDIVPKDDQGNIIHGDEHFIPTWKALEECVKEGLIHSIGLSNFNRKQIQELWDSAEIKPAALQGECSPYNIQMELFSVCKEKGIVFTAFSPLGSNDHPARKPEDPVLFKEPSLKALADKHGKSIAQVVLRWILQRGFLVIPKSVTPSRIEENLNVFDFELSAEDMEEVAKLHQGWRSCWFWPAKTNPRWPFNEPF